MPAGLEDVVAGESGICFIDGNQGILAYRGYNIHELATNSTFEETCHLLWFRPNVHANHGGHYKPHI